MTDPAAAHLEAMDHDELLRAFVPAAVDSLRALRQQPSDVQLACWAHAAQVRDDLEEEDALSVAGVVEYARAVMLAGLARGVRPGSVGSDAAWFGMHLGGAWIVLAELGDLDDLIDSEEAGGSGQDQGG